MGNSLTEENKKDKRLIWASVKNVIDLEWDEILSRNVKISEKDFDEISKLMEASYLERNSFIIRRLS